MAIKKSGQEIRELILGGESSRVEFKGADVNMTSLAEEVVAFANMDGGFLLIGVDDAGDVVGCNAREMETRVINVCRNAIRPSLIPLLEKVRLDEKEILVVEVKASEAAHSTTQGRYFIRVGSTKQIPTQQELLRLFQRRKLLQFDETPVLGASVDNIDLSRVEAYLARLGVSPLAAENGEALQRDLRNLSILSAIEPACPTLAGLLAFARQPQKFYPAYGVMCGAYQGRDLAAPPIRENEIQGSLPDLIENAIAFLKLTMPQAPRLVEGLRMENNYAYPIEALREAIVNAVAHRDYTIAGAAIRIFVFQDRLEIRSPGGLPNTLTLESLPYRQFTRNQSTSSFLAGLGYMERRGKGIIRMRKLAAERGVLCVFALTPDEAEFVVTFSRVP
jgi:ATP-dependent DNA helicase RecG